MLYACVEYEQRVSGECVKCRMTSELSLVVEAGVLVGDLLCISPHLVSLRGPAVAVFQCFVWVGLECSVSSILDDNY